MDFVIKTGKIVKPKRKSKGFAVFYLLFVTMIIGASAYFLNYVWESIELYEKTMPENIVEYELQLLKDGKHYDIIQYPELQTSEFSDFNIIHMQYEDILQTAPLTYKYAKDDYITGRKYYNIYADDQPVGKLILKIRSEENRLGIMDICYLEVEQIEPLLDVATWNCNIKAYSDQDIYINDVLVSDKYIAGEPQNVNEYEYLYDYVELPKIVFYQVEQLYERPQVTVKDRNGNEVEYNQDGMRIDSTLRTAAEDTIPEYISSEVDVLKAAKDWSYFTTKDLAGPNYGLATVRKHFIKDSYMWNKLGEYAHGVDITFVSAHGRTYTTDEQISEFRQHSDNCFSCKVQFKKHMILSYGKDQIDETNSYFYFVNIDDTDDGIDNPQWKIADIQAVTK